MTTFEITKVVCSNSMLSADNAKVEQNKTCPKDHNHRRTYSSLPIKRNSTLSDTLPLSF